MAASTARVTSDKRPYVTVVIPTTCESARAGLLPDAIDSALSQRDVAVEVVVVVNGARVDESLLARLPWQATILRRAEGNVSAARHAGRQAAQGEFTCFVDDDDRLLPDALRIRLAVAAAHPDADVIVTNGLESSDGVETPLVAPGRADEINRDPRASLLRANWFGSSAIMVRNATVPSDVFAFDLRYFEWTWLLFALLAQGKRVHYDEAMTFWRSGDNPLSASRSAKYFAAYPAFLRELGRLPMSAAHRRAIESKYQTALNTLSNQALQDGELGRAWQLHWQCLSDGGWRYAPYTRHLIRQSMRR